MSSLAHPGVVSGGAGGADCWIVTLEEREKHHHLFYSLSPAGGFITGEQARGFFLQSGLPQLVLAQVWALADDDRDGRVDLVGFSVAMKLIKMALLGHPLPLAVPPITLHSLTGHAHGRTAAAAPCHLSPGVAPPPMLPGPAHAVPPCVSVGEGPTHAPAFPVSDSFLERRRENMERGEAELQRRREALREAQRKEEQEEIARQTAARRQQLEGQREGSRAEVQALRQRRDVLAARLLALAQSRQEAQAGAAATRQSAAECRSRLDALDERAGRLDAESRRLEAQVGAAQSSLEALRAQRAQLEGRLQRGARGGGGLDSLAAEVHCRRAAVQSLREKVEAIELQIQQTQAQRQDPPSAATATTASASSRASGAGHAGSAPAFQPPVAIVPPSLAPTPSNAGGAISSSSSFSEQQRQQQQQQWQKQQQQPQEQGGPCVAACEAEEWGGGGGGGGGGGASQPDVGWARFPEFGDPRPAQPRAGVARSRGSQSERRTGPHGGAGSNSFLERNISSFPAVDGSHGNDGKPSAASAFTPQAPSASAYCPLGSCVRAVALCRFQAVQPNHLAFCTGDVISVRERQDLWWLGEVAGRSGWFPKSYVRVTDGDAAAVPPPLPPPLPLLANGARSQRGACTASEEEARREGRDAAVPSDSWNHSKSRPYTSILRRVSKPKAPAPPVHRHEKCAALFDYTSKEAGDLSFLKGDIITLVSKNDRDWWTGTLNGKTGLFPSNHVEVLTTKAGEPSAPSAPSSAPASAPACPGGSAGRGADTTASRPGGPSARSVVALYDYCAQNSDELSFVRGQSIGVTRQAHPDWWEGEAGGLRGLFPSNYVREVLPPESSL
ncbi:uncharacterized protein LOC144733443 [Lampetra planeri]